MPSQEEVTQSLTNEKDMQSLVEEVQGLFPFARVRMPKNADGYLHSFIGVHYGDSCIMTVNRNELEDMKRFMHAFFMSELENHGISTEDLDALLESKRQPKSQKGTEHA